MRSVIGFLNREEGATAIEYGLIASLIAVAIVGVLSPLARLFRASSRQFRRTFKSLKVCFG